MWHLRVNFPERGQWTIISQLPFHLFSSIISYNWRARSSQTPPELFWEEFAEVPETFQKTIESPWKPPRTFSGYLKIYARTKTNNPKKKRATTFFDHITLIFCTCVAPMNVIHWFQEISMVHAPWLIKNRFWFWLTDVLEQRLFWQHTWTPLQLVGLTRSDIQRMILIGFAHKNLYMFYFLSRVLKP